MSIAQRIKPSLPPKILWGGKNGEYKEKKTIKGKTINYFMVYHKIIFILLFSFPFSYEKIVFIFVPLVFFFLAFIK